MTTVHFRSRPDHPREVESWSPENRERARRLIELYPDKRSAVMPLLYLAMVEHGYVTDEAMEEVAAWLGITPAQVQVVVTFYTMYKQQPVGRYLVSVCTSLPCMLRDADAVLHAVEEETGVPDGETGADWLFSVEHVECIGACGGAPAVQVNYELVEGVVPEKARELCRWLRDGSPPVVLSDEMQQLFGGQRSFEWGPSEIEGAVAPVPAFGPFGTAAGNGNGAGASRAAPAEGEGEADGRRLILTARMSVHPRDSDTLDRYRETGGYRALRKALEEMTPEQVQEEVTKSNLRGRGGAGFPTGRKWAFMGDATPRYLIVNADESEPGTFKDRQVLERDPHLLLEGASIAAYALGVNRAFIYVRGEYARPARRLQRALGEAYEAGFLGADILGSGFDLDLSLHLGAGAYICGEETAMLNSLEGKRGEPRIRPPYPAVQGLYDRPTVVNNVETLSMIPWIVEQGGEAFASLGTEGSTGTRLFSLSGHVEHPGNYEIEQGITFREFIDRFGGGIREGRELKAFIPGGASAPWLTAEHLDVPIDMEAVGEVGSMLGSGAITVMDDRTCMVRAAHRLVRFFAHESCGECTPCREGTGWLEMVLLRIEEGAGRHQDLGLLLDVSDNISPGLVWPPRMTTICALGPSAVSPINSLLTHFEEETLRHVDEGRCPLA